jgi:predicted permease
MWTMGIATLTGATPRESLGKIVNVPSMAILAGLLLNLAGGRTWLPGFVLAGVHLVGQSAIPMGLLLIGATMFDLCRQLDLHAGWRALAGAVLLRLVVTPPLFIWLAWSLPASALELRHVLIVQAGMPAAILPIVLARHYDGDARLAVRIVLVTTAVGLLLVPFWLRWGGG